MNYATPYQYAKLCKVSAQAIYQRISTGALKTVIKKDITGSEKEVIDLRKYPPVKFSVGRPKKIKKSI